MYAKETNRNTYRHKGGHLLAVFNQLHTHTFANGGVGLLGFDPDLLQHDALCMGGASGGRGLIDIAEGALFVGFIGLEKEDKTEGKRRRYINIPIGFHGGRCAICVRLAVHEVYWL